MTTLYDFFMTKDFNYGADIADDTYDVALTFEVSEDDLKSSDPYFKYQVELSKHIPFIKEFNGTFASVIADFTKFVMDNMDLIKSYIKKNWNENWQYVLDDEDELIYEFIKYLDDGLVGSWGDKTYKGMIDLLKHCK